MTERLGGFAKVGDAVPLGAFRLTVCEVDGLRISRLLLARPAGEPSVAGSE